MRLFCLFLGLLCFGGQAQAGGVRDHTRPTHERDTQVSETWLRVAGEVTKEGYGLHADSCLVDARYLKPGLRVIAFPANAKSSISQARISHLESRGDCVQIEAMLAGPDHRPGDIYVMEIIIPRGYFLAIPREAIIEDDAGSLVYVQHMGQHYMPRRIHTGIEGERYTEVLHGLNRGEKIVTLGSFFIHAQHRLQARSGTGSSTGMGHAHHTH